MPSTQTIKNYLSLVKFSHTIFALPFALIGYFFAITRPDSGFSVKTLILVLLAMVFARNAAMSFNRYTDRFIDKRNPRTANREIPSGVITPRHALLFSIANAILFVVTTHLMNNLVFYLSPVALLVILGYSYTKRYTVLCHFILGLGLSFAPIGAYLSVTGQWAIEPLILSFIVILWVGGFDILYSIQDEEYDKEESLKSIPSILGQKVANLFAGIAHAIVTALVIVEGIILDTGSLYWIGTVLFILLLILQHFVLRKEFEKRINFVFSSLNGTASLLFAIFTILSFYIN